MRMMMMMRMKTHDQRSAGLLRDQRQQHQQVVPQLTLVMTETVQEQMEERVLQRSVAHREDHGNECHAQITITGICNFHSTLFSRYCHAKNYCFSFLLVITHCIVTVFIRELCALYEEFHSSRIEVWGGGL